jgi:uncharacterized protein involved in exopolysaccharide biosynthesis
MPDFYQPMRQLPSGMPPMDGGYERPAGDSMSLGQLFGVLRRRYRLVLIITLLGLGTGAYLAARAPASYKATAVLRLAGERRALTGEVDPTPELERTTNPILSVAELVRSRSVLGAVVDSLGLRLLSATPEIGTSQLARVYVAPEATNDTVQVTFYQNGVKARLRGREARGRYGEQLDLGPVRFAVTGVPDVSSASLYVIPREMAIDNLYSKISVLSRPETDIMDVAYVAPNPRTAQRIVNTTVLAFRELNILTAKEKSQRRRQFLEEQLK